MLNRKNLFQNKKKTNDSMHIFAFFSLCEPKMHVFALTLSEKKVRVCYSDLLKLSMNVILKDEKNLLNYVDIPRTSYT